MAPLWTIKATSRKSADTGAGSDKDLRARGLSPLAQREHSSTQGRAGAAAGPAGLVRAQAVSRAGLWPDTDLGGRQPCPGGCWKGV